MQRAAVVGATIGRQFKPSSMSSVALQERIWPLAYAATSAVVAPVLRPDDARAEMHTFFVSTELSAL